jgi:uncharacterized protein YndB with AHSA1/START domain
MMETKEKTIIAVSVTIEAPVESVWESWTKPMHIMHWNNASDDWHTTRAENDLRVGGRFLYRMEAKDGSNGFDFSGEYSIVQKYKDIEYILDDERKVKVSFEQLGTETMIKEIFEVDQQNPIEMQKAGWQSILNNFRNYVESSSSHEVLHYEIEIGCTPEEVYNIMLDEEKYKEWTSVFNPTSHYKGSWERGSKILFLGTDKDGNLEGMVSFIKENIPYKFVSIEHRGIIKNGEEVTCGPEVESWKGLENYTFSSVSDQKTLLSIDMDSNQVFKPYFDETYPKALETLRSLCEHHN